MRPLLLFMRIYDMDKAKTNPGKEGQTIGHGLDAFLHMYTYRSVYVIPICLIYKWYIQFIV